MEFTPEDIICRMEVYAQYAYRIKELKDLLLEFDIFGDEDLISDSMHHQDGIIMEIREIYQDKMVPIIDEMADYVATHMHVLHAPPGQALAIGEEEPWQDGNEKSRGQALDMGNSLLTSLISEMVDNHGA
jgi:hypothetical protein